MLRGLHMPNLLKKKGGESLDPANYRGITISSCIGKIFTKIMADRLWSFLDIQQHN